MERLGKTIFYIIFAAIPAVLWYASSGFDATSFSSGYQMVSIIAKMAAIVGICFFSGNLILSGRYKIVDRLFGGLDRVYLFHRRTGITTFILLSTHVVLISARTLFESYDAFIAFVTNITYLPINFGRFAYGGLFVIIVITLWFGRKIKYERLKFIHSFMGVFLFFGGLHAFFIPSDIATNLPLRWYVLGLASLGIISWLVRTVFKRWLVRRHILDVIQVNPLPGIVTEVIMKPRNEKIRFLPGQFIFVRFRQKGFPYEDHPFSLTASPEEGRLRISAKAIGDFTTKLKELKPGAEAHVQGPFGGFSFLRFKNKKQIWIAGGIGITPFISMARYIRDNKDKVRDFNITLFYSVKDEKEFVYKNELEEISRKVPQLTFRPWNTKTQGYLTAEAVKKTLDLQNKDIFICGPQPMLHSLRTQFNNLGVVNSHIHFELFKLF